MMARIASRMLPLDHHALQCTKAENGRRMRVQYQRVRSEFALQEDLPAFSMP